MAELEYPLDEDRARDMMHILLDRCYRRWGKWGKCSVKLEWMSPIRFLNKVPHPATPIIPASVGLSERFYNRSSIEWIKKAIESGKKLDPLYLDYSHVHNGFPDHEGRHRAFVAYRLGIEKVPVIVVRVE